MDSDSNATTQALTDALTEGLNEHQKEAIIAPNHHLLVLAGAGSGKTRVLTHRLAWLIANNQAQSSSILAVTFTNKAAKEMVTRIQALPGFSEYSNYRFRQMWLGTFHGICNRFLRTHYREAGLSENVQVIDSNEQLSVVKQVAEKLKINLDDYPARDLQYYINARKEEGLRAGEDERFDVDAELKDNFFFEYDKYCSKENLLDFCELLLRTYEVLKRNSSLREHYQDRFTHILVDEFQDTNTLQYALIKILTKTNPKTGGQAGAAIFAVGDDDQSIYGFRGAKVENIRHFEKYYAGKNIVRLEQSYRSTSNILSAANELIANNNGRLGKTLWTAQNKGEPITVYPAYNDEEEARWIFGKIQSLGEQAIPLDDIAILYRINAHSRAFEHQAIKHGIPYKIYGGFRFYDRAEIRNLLAFLRLIANPHDETSFLRVVNFPPRAIGNKSLGDLKEISTSRNISLMQSIEFVEGRASKSLWAFAHLINDIRDSVTSLSLAEIIKVIIEKVGINTYYEKQRDGAERMENIGELINAATQYQQEIGNLILEEADEVANISTTENSIIEDQPANLNLLESMPSGKTSSGLEVVSRFLSDAVLDSAEPQGSEKSAISMMSVHAAKGLEFEVVFIAGLEHGTFPHEFNKDLEEERRLMYVAITRAKKHLHLSFAHQRLLHGKIRQNVPSLFLQELPQELIESLPQQLNPRFAYANKSFDTKQKFLNSSNSQQNSFTSKGSGKSNSSEANQPYTLGSIVRHPKFGNGVVQKYEGKNDDARILISFSGFGQKWLLLSLAKLEKM